MKSNLIENNKEVLNKALELINSNADRGVQIRLLGGLACFYIAKQILANHEFLHRKYNDLDFIGHKKDSKNINFFSIKVK